MTPAINMNLVPTPQMSAVIQEGDAPITGSDAAVDIQASDAAVDLQA